jgi:hypothetical protein
MSDEFRVALAGRSPDSFSAPRITPVADYLSARRAGTADWEPDLERTAMSLEVDGEERLGTQVSLSGQLDLLAAQFVPARDRLRAGEPALIRFADHDEVGEYLLLEPKGDKVSVSKFDIHDNPPMDDYPFPHRPEESQRLYGYVADNRENLDIEVGPFDVARDPLLEALEREARLVDELYRELGETPVTALVPKP